MLERANVLPWRSYSRGRFFGTQFFRKVLLSVVKLRGGAPGVPPMRRALAGRKTGATPVPAQAAGLKGTTAMQKKPVIFCDGTWNKPTKYSTNVLRMLQATEPEDEGKNPQLVYYVAGIGTRKGEKFRGGTFGYGISDNIMNVYSYIVSNYERGDEIFLFGFSRGAFTARSMAGLIRNFGILKRPHLPLVYEAYSHYRDGSSEWHPNGSQTKAFREKYCHGEDTKIKFVGVWDTVGALGAPFGSVLGWIVDKLFKCSFHDTKLST